MNIRIGDELFFPKDIHCLNTNEYRSNINCQHWSIDDDCKTSCKLNVINNPTRDDCNKCPHRLSWKGKKIIRVDDVTKAVELLDTDETEMPIEKPKLSKSQEEFEEEVTKSFIEKTKSYIQAESSQAIQGKVSKEAFERRKSICMSCEFRINDTKGAHDTIGWCKGGCGCTVGNPRAALSQKLYMPTLSCPKGKFGIEKGSGFNTEDAKDSVKGIFESVKNLFKKDK